MKRVLRVKGRRLFALLLSLSFLGALSAQPTFYIEDQSVEVNSTFEVTIKVKDFVDILGMQYTIRWDSDDLSFESLNQFSLDMDENNFGTVQSSNGILNFSFIDMSLEGVSLPDDAVLFSIMFRVTGLAGEDTEVEFSSVPTIKEITDVNQEELEASYDNGNISLLGPTDVREVSIALLSLSEISPNPFSSQTQVSWQQQKAGQLTWELHNSLGQRVAQGQNYYPSGQHQLILTEKQFKNPGTYILYLRQESYSISEKLVFVKP